ncbi:MAG: CbrC family protein [Actinomycetales bacterium]|nr:CbrC family protein [Actinomycetales bacterium]
MPTFADLDIDVPLFAAPIDAAKDFAGTRTCLLCGQRWPCFLLGRDHEVIATCDECCRAVPVNARRRSGGCPRCGRTISIRETLQVVPELLTKVYACAGCLRAGRWAQTMVTELGVVRWPDGFSPAADQPALGPARSAFQELLRTPVYATFQGENWLVCHDVPMTFLGQWCRTDLDAARPGAGAVLLAEIVEDSQPDVLWESGLGESIGTSPAGVYVFRCERCGRLRAHSDCG